MLLLPLTDHFLLSAAHPPLDCSACWISALNLKTILHAMHTWIWACLNLFLSLDSGKMHLASRKHEKIVLPIYYTITAMTHLIYDLQEEVEYLESRKLL